MRIGTTRVAFLSLLLLALFGSVAASKLRGTRGRRVKQNAESLLFTEGRKGGGYGGKNNDDDDTWNSADGGSYDPEMAESYDGGGQKQQKGETIYDRPPMKFSKEGEHEEEYSNKGGNKMSSDKGSGTKYGGGMKEQSGDVGNMKEQGGGTKEQGSSTKGQGSYKGGGGDSKDNDYNSMEPANSYDDIPEEGAPHEGSYSDKPSAKGQGRDGKFEVSHILNAAPYSANISTSLSKSQPLIVS